MGGLREGLAWGSCWQLVWSRAAGVERMHPDGAASRPEQVSTHHHLTDEPIHPLATSTHSPTSQDFLLALLGDGGGGRGGGGEGLQPDAGGGGGGGGGGRQGDGRGAGAGAGLTRQATNQPSAAATAGQRRCGPQPRAHRRLSRPPIFLPTASADSCRRSSIVLPAAAGAPRAATTTEASSSRLMRPEMRSPAGARPACRQARLGAWQSGAVPPSRRLHSTPTPHCQPHSHPYRPP